MAKPNHVGVALAGGALIGLTFNAPAVLVARRVVLSGRQSLRAFLWPFRLIMWSAMLGACAGLIIGEPTFDNVAISAVLVVFYVALIEFITRRPGS